MIAVKISFLSLLKDRIGVEELNMDLEDNATINDVFFKLFEKFGEDIKTVLVKKTGELNDHVVTGHCRGIKSDNHKRFRA